MINIRPVSDLRNKFPELEKTVMESNEPVFLTKNASSMKPMQQQRNRTNDTPQMKSSPE